MSHMPYPVRYVFWLVLAVLDRVFVVEHFNPYLSVRTVARVKAKRL